MSFTRISFVKLAHLSITSLMFFLSTSAFAEEAKKTDPETPTPEEMDYEALQRFGAIFEQIKNEYVEEVGAEDLANAAINGMLTSLDPHSSYLTNDDFEEMLSDSAGKFGGIGIEVTHDLGVIKVISPMDGTPAFEAGLQAGDYITHADGESLTGLNLNEQVDILRGPLGSTITLTIFREGAEAPFDVTLTRAEIKVASAKARLIDSMIVLRLSQFGDETYDEMLTAFEEQLKEIGGIDNLTGVVLDLRNNPGGILQTAVDISDAFLEQGEIVSTRGRTDKDQRRSDATSGDIAQGKPLVVLINNGSASASEIVAGALGDHDRAIIVGEPSFGKGSVQTLSELPDGSALKMTTARYYTPSGRSIQGLGIEPDIYIEQPRNKTLPQDSKTAENETLEDEKESNRFGEEDLPGSLENDSLSEEERTALQEEHKQHIESGKLRDEDFQLAYALDIIRSLGVRGGE